MKLSDCCNAPIIENSEDMCSDCKEHSDVYDSVTFKEWVCKKAGISDYYCDEWEDNKQANEDEIVYLMKAMWAINRESIIHMYMDFWKIHVGMSKEFLYEDYNNSEVEALTKALEYIKDNE